MHQLVVSPLADYKEGDDVIDLVNVVHESHRLMKSRAADDVPLFLYLFTRYTYYDAPMKFYRKVRN